ncbi:hypothetical protein BAUCODRAFT_124953 [Baudoinia panamericana UAMH 10762]|uniref:Uncharacterized protein n=1 Tax=Baudoinia panamericana (strain UAMH 10762) TaxID=717646 RepID=M2MCI4_BAUPA|nr:uncharacterized protein BAUCODRAFT_124953 [Baudoinia panamericana UAMH 10762]EMC94236.1 hypothetical protein BAUCODRAFT_124953 [Baudoinia panamericana UAMH 10762]
MRDPYILIVLHVPAPSEQSRTAYKTPRLPYLPTPQTPVSLLIRIPQDHPRIGMSSANPTPNLHLSLTTSSFLTTLTTGLLTSSQ